jgi:hypothetical protein
VTGELRRQRHAFAPNLMQDRIIASRAMIVTIPLDFFGFSDIVPLRVCKHWSKVHR